MLMIYQWLLSGLVQIWVEKSPRYWEGENHQQHGESNGLIQGTVTIGWDWFVANREGILGCVGYASLFGITEWIAYHYFWHAPQTSSLAPLLRKSRSSKRLWVVSAHVLLIWRIVTHLVAEPSRRTTNGTFVVWVLLVNVLQVAAIHSIVTKNHVTHRPPMILSAISRNGFVLFVIANLLTGAVNLSINTLEVDDRTATVIIAMYMSVMGIIAFVLDRVKGYLPNRRKRETQEQNHHHID
jgi:phosphatidylinositol glycan class W